MYKCIGLISALLMLAACEKHELKEPVEPIEIRYQNVDEDLQTYFAAYEEAAAARGIEVDLAELGISAHFRNIGESGVAGECAFSPDDPNSITIDVDTWEAVPETFKEYIIFHELGHCERLRPHREDDDDNGRCVSIMASGVGNCRTNYNRSTRAELLDELFDEQFYGTWP